VARAARGRRAQQTTEQQKADKEKTKAAEDAYKYDPWKNAR
jgi:hypothetical protein